MVSGKRSRFSDDEFDLDLTYITPQVIAMSFPAKGAEALYRNPAADVERMLQKYHPDGYIVVNLSWKSYERGDGEEAVPFFGRSMSCGCLDHHAMPLQPLMQLVKNLDVWLFGSGAPKSAVAVHCIAGKGRTGMVICAFLVYTNLLPLEDGMPHRSHDLMEEAQAMTLRVTEHFLEKRGQGVEYPSQRRYIEYIARLVLEARKAGGESVSPQPPTFAARAGWTWAPPPTPARLLHRFVLTGVPLYEDGCVPIIQVLALPAEWTGGSASSMAGRGVAPRRSMSGKNLMRKISGALGLLGAVDENFGDSDGVGSGETLLYSSAWAMGDGDELPIFRPGARGVSVPIVIEVNQPVAGDLLIRALHHPRSAASPRLMFRTAFNTAFIPERGIFNLPLSELDETDDLCTGGAGPAPASFAFEVHFAEEVAETPIEGSHVAADGVRSSFRSFADISRLGYLFLNQGGSWRRFWCVLRKDMLSLFASKADRHAEYRIPLKQSVGQWSSTPETGVKLGWELSIYCSDPQFEAAFAVARREPDSAPSPWAEDTDSFTALRRWAAALAKGGLRLDPNPPAPPPE